MLAYSSLIRSVIWSAWRVASNFVIVKLRIYYIWLGIRGKWGSERVSRRAQETVQAFRNKVEQQRQQHLRKQKAKKRAKQSERYNSPAEKRESPV